MNIKQMTYKQMNSWEQKAYDDYKCSSFNINSQLRITDQLSKISFSVELFDALIAKYETIVDLELYRVLPLRYVNVYKVGDVYRDKGYLSTTVDKGVLLKYWPDRQENEVAVFRVFCPSGIHMLNMELNEQGSGLDDEYLLGRDSKFEITERSEIDDKYEILDYLDGYKDYACDTDKIVEFQLLAL